MNRILARVLDEDRDDRKAVLKRVVLFKKSSLLGWDEEDQFFFLLSVA